MDETKSLDSKAPEEILQDIEETRNALADKIGSLEAEVKDTVSNAQASVAENVEHFKQIFDIKRQIQNHPWTFVGGALVLGIAASQLIPRERRTFESPTGSEPIESPEPKVSRTASMLNAIGRQLKPELAQLKGMAVIAVAQAVRKLVTENLSPSVSDQVGRVVENATRKLGGEAEVDETAPEGQAPHTWNEMSTPAH